ncbi:MAG: ComF family protein [bacterium]|nr:ComF family protein [bacterium]
MKVREIIDAFVDFIWPPKCLICDNSLEDGKKFICDECAKGVNLFSPPFCFHCGKPLFYSGDLSERLCAPCKEKKGHFDRAFIIGSYENSLREAVHQFKYNKKAALRKYFSVLINDYVEKNNVLDKVDVIVPVPLFLTKKRERGFNQSELLAKEISKKWSLPVSTKNLYRARHTEPQYNLDYTGREKNIKGAFKLKDKDIIEGKRVLLIDDVVTTGATINECSRILKNEGKAKDVFVLSLAGKLLDYRL